MILLCRKPARCGPRPPCPSAEQALRTRIEPWQDSDLDPDLAVAADATRQPSAWPQIRRLQHPLRAGFAYIDAVVDRNLPLAGSATEDQPTCGDRHYRPARGIRGLLPTHRLPVGTCEEALDTPAGSTSRPHRLGLTPDELTGATNSVACH